jgi:hypothetical protein
LPLEGLWDFRPITHTVKITILNCYFIWYQGYIYIYNRHVSRLQELISLTENWKLGEWMVHTLTCNCVSFKVISREMRERWRGQKKYDFYRIRILECGRSLQNCYLESGIFPPQFLLFTHSLSKYREGKLGTSGVCKCTMGCEK